MKKRKLSRKIAFVLGTCGISTVGVQGCAGPTSPLGAARGLTAGALTQSPGGPTGEASRRPASSTGEPGSPVIRIEPRRQVLHGPAPLRITVDGVTGLTPGLRDYRLFVRYNGLDVTESFLAQGRTRVETPEGGKPRLVLETSRMRLPPESDQVIEFYFLGPEGQGAHAFYRGPECHGFRDDAIHNLAGFRPPKAMVSSIERSAREGGVNPAFVAGLVAQESGFRPRVVSWAKAVGLTQITPVAELELIARDPGLRTPRYPGLNELPAPMMKALVLSGKVNRANEWRLDTERSIRGGVDFLVILAERWSTAENMRRIRLQFKDAEGAHTRLILASYHSGYSRVLSAFNRLGARWLEASELQEASKYVNRVLSYCDRISDEGSHDENEA